MQLIKGPQNIFRHIQKTSLSSIKPRLHNFCWNILPGMMGEGIPQYFYKMSEAKDSIVTRRKKEVHQHQVELRNQELPFDD